MPLTQKERYNQAVAAGLCVDCWLPRDGNSKSRCSQCLRKKADQERAKYGRSIAYKPRTPQPKSSQYRNVSFHKSHGKWMAYIVDRAAERQITIGLFNSELEAAQAYNEKAIELYGDEANLNELPADPPDPEPHEIVAACAGIRESWSDDDYAQRAPHLAVRKAKLYEVIERDLITG